MNKLPESSRNEQSSQNGKGAYPMLETRRSIQPTVYTPRPPSVLPLMILCFTVGLGIAIFMGSVRPPEVSQSVSETEAFRLAVNRAMNAAELTQTAQSSKEWQQVTNWWQEAIDLMRAVPTTDDKHALAVEKVTEYQSNLRYAQQRLATLPSQSSSQPSPVQDLWGIGSRRAMVLKVQGPPTAVDRYDSMCKEVLHYDKSKVELSNGMVATYEDFDRKLKVGEIDVPLSASQDKSTWDLGSSKQAVFNLQGTPTRVVQYEYSQRETLYYGNDTVEILKGHVIGYANQNGTLKVRTVPVMVDDKDGGNIWTLDSRRETVLRIQGTPTSVVLDNPACLETFYYGKSSVTLKNGFLTGYNNLDNNLRVRAR